MRKLIVWISLIAISVGLMVTAVNAAEIRYHQTAIRCYKQIIMTGENAGELVNGVQCTEGFTHDDWQNNWMFCNISGWGLEGTFNTTGETVEYWGQYIGCWDSYIIDDPTTTPSPSVTPNPEETLEPGTTATVTPDLPAVTVTAEPIFIAPQPPENTTTDSSKVVQSDKMWIENWPNGNGFMHADGKTRYTKVLVVVQLGGDWYYFPETTEGFTHEHYAYLQASDGSFHSR